LKHCFDANSVVKGLEYSTRLFMKRLAGI